MQRGARPGPQPAEGIWAPSWGVDGTGGKAGGRGGGEKAAAPGCGDGKTPAGSALIQKGPQGRSNFGGPQSCQSGTKGRAHGALKRYTMIISGETPPRACCTRGRFPQVPRLPASRCPRIPFLPPPPCSSPLALPGRKWRECGGGRPILTSPGAGRGLRGPLRRRETGHPPPYRGGGGEPQELGRRRSVPGQVTSKSSLVFDGSQMKNGGKATELETASCWGERTPPRAGTSSQTRTRPAPEGSGPGRREGSRSKHGVG